MSTALEALIQVATTGAKPRRPPERAVPVPEHVEAWLAEPGDQGRTPSTISTRFKALRVSFGYPEEEEEVTASCVLSSCGTTVGRAPHVRLDLGDAGDRVAASSRATATPPRHPAGGIDVNVRRKREIVGALLARYPHTFAEELGIRRLDRPAPLFQLLVMSLLMSARIRARVAFNATRAVLAAGWTTPPRMVAASWEERTRTLNVAGYGRYDGRTSTMLGATAAAVVGLYGGDLRRLRADADREPSTERQLLKQFKGIGDVGVDIFFREVQVAWPEVYPFADRRALNSAELLDVGVHAEELVRLAEGMDFVRLVNALVRVDLEHAHDEVRAAAGTASGGAEHPSTVGARRLARP